MPHFSSINTQAVISSVSYTEVSSFPAKLVICCVIGTGKTYTMLGSQEEPGIMVHTLNNLFKRIEETKDEMEYQVSMGYLEVI